ncbi:MAG: hypothetical protein KF716_21305 [Anaerolineae bacterium]|nr:hypothetical protein [Anaerolineae bacterium]
MFTHKTVNRNENGQAALETAIILIAFIVVSSIFAFTILSAGSSSTEKGKEAIAAGMQSVQSSMSVKGAVIAKANATKDAVDTVVFTLALVSGGSPIDLKAAAADRKVIIGYRDGAVIENNLDWTVTFIGKNNGDALLENGELAEITVTIPTGKLVENQNFTLEVKPPTGAVLIVTRTTPPAIAAVMELN